MIARPRIHRLLAAALTALALAGCAAQIAYREGTSLVAQDKVEAGLAKYQEAVAADPGNAMYKAAWLRTREAAAMQELERADRALDAGKLEQALQHYRRTLAIEPANERARAGLNQVEAYRRHGAMFDAARAAFDKKDYEGARLKLAALLAERPTHEGARRLLVLVEEASAPPAAETALAAAYRKPISLEFRDAPMKQIFEVIARHSGLNFVFDKDVKADQRASIFLKNSTVEAAVYFLLVTNQLERQVMDGNTILIYPNIATKLKDYQEMTVKTFFLANAEAKNIANTFKTILKSRDVVVDEKLNLVILRDSPEAIKLATQLVALQDIAEPEVMLDVEVLEIQRSRMMELGVQWPSSLSLTPLIGIEGPVTIDELRGVSSKTIGVRGVAATINANKIDGDSNTLANPRIRVRNKEKARVVIGDKLPIFTTTVSAGVGGFASESITYVDVGLTLNVEPTISLNDEVAIRISLDVSNLVEKVTTPTGTVAYRIGSRSASTLLQLKDGENQVLAGLIKNEDRSSGRKVPGVGNLPLIGRLFGSTNDANDKTEIVLSITPHLVRNIQRPAASQSEFGAGTEGSFRRRPDTAVRLPISAGMPAGAAPRVVPAAPALPSPVSGTLTPSQPAVVVTPVAEPMPAPLPVINPNSEK